MNEEELVGFGVADASSFNQIGITAGGRTGGIRAWWLSTTRYVFQGLETHVSASDPQSHYTKFVVARHYDGP